MSVQVKDISDIEVICAMRDYLEWLDADQPVGPVRTPADRLAVRYPLKVAQRKVEKMLEDGTYFDIVKSHFGTLTPAAEVLLREHDL